MKTLKFTLVALLLALVSTVGASAQSNKTKKVGDIVSEKGVKCVVVDCDKSGNHGLLMTIEAAECNWGEALNWCGKVGAQWRLPELTEMMAIYMNLEEVNESLEKAGYEPLVRTWYWVAEVEKKGFAWAVNMVDLSANYAAVSKPLQVRAVTAF